MLKRILIFLLILLLCIVIYFFFSDDKAEKKVYENKIESKKEDSSSSSSSKKNYTNFLHPEANGNQIIAHQIYTLSYSEKDEQAEWVAYKLFKNSINDSVKRKDNFRKDLKVVSGSANLKDYKKSGFDRGHLAPAKAMSFSKQTMSESFYMSNMSPQKPSFNRGIWKRLEEKVRGWILISDSLYVVTGPVLNKPLGRIGENNVTVPNSYYKSIIRFNNNELFGIGFLLKNEKSNNDLASFSVSIDSIEKITSLNFFHELDSVIQNRIEQNSNYQYFSQK